jgi:hypothetical protein
MRKVLQVEELKAKYHHTQPLYPGRTLREVEPFERAAAGRDVDDDTPKAWFELPHPPRVLVTGLLSLVGICWLLWHVLQPGR